MSKRDRSVRTPAQKVQRAIALPLAYGIGKPLIALAEAFGAGPWLITLASRLQHGRDPWPAMWRGYEPTASDVIVGSYMKSGTNWALQLAHQILWRGEGEFDHIHDVVPWPDEVTRGYAIDLRDDAVRRACPSGRRVIKTHAPWSGIPKSPEARYVLVVRDPKDVFVSSYPFLRGAAFGPLMPSVATWYEAFLSPHFPPGPWAEHAHGYWTARHEPNVLLLSFKEMKTDLAGTVRRMASFLEVDLTDAERERVCERSSFRAMHADQARFAPGAATPFSEFGAPMLRRGAQGGAGEMLSLAQQERIDRHFREVLASLGSDLDWDWICSPPAP